MLPRSKKQSCYSGPRSIHSGCFHALELLPPLPLQQLLQESCNTCFSALCSTVNADLCAVAQHWYRPAVYCLHQCHYGVRQVHMRPGDRRHQQRRHRGYGEPAGASEAANHSRLSSYEPSQQSAGSQSSCPAGTWGQLADFQLGHESQDEVICNDRACCVLEMDFSCQAGSGHSYLCVSLGHERES